MVDQFLCLLRMGGALHERDRVRHDERADPVLIGIHDRDGLVLLEGLVGIIRVRESPRQLAGHNEVLGFAVARDNLDAIGLHTVEKRPGLFLPHSPNSAATCVVVVPKSGFASPARPFQRGSTRSSTDDGASWGFTWLVLYTITRALAAKPAQ